MHFHPPVRDLSLALKVVGHADLTARAFPELDGATVEAVLEGAAAFARDVLAPLNRIGDQHGARIGEGGVTAPPGFAAAYGQFVEQGWNTLSADPEHGGQGLTKALDLAVFEMFHAANMAFTLCPMLTQGAIEALAQHGTRRQKDIILPKLVSGEWSGTMNLTEAQAGSDLSALTTRAERDADGGYLLTGQKIFITWGDHDMAENVCHLVLARMPDAVPGVRGISLFLATKFAVNDDGSLGERNSASAVSIEHKLGIHGSPTCVMQFEGARAELVGEAGRGLAHMFTMMNAARQQVGLEGVGIGERAFQQALAFSLERRQGRSAWAKESPAAIFNHPDVRRTLALMKGRVEAARGICLMTALWGDVARVASQGPERDAARARVELLTPIAKAWSTDMGVDVASAGVQVHGGMGFVEETGAAQHYRDARIAPIYEGTNGIQAVDLVARKVPSDEGATMLALCAEIATTVVRLADVPENGAAAAWLGKARIALEQATRWIVANPGMPALSAATAYLKLAGDVIGGDFLARQAIAASAMTGAWADGKGLLFRLYASQILSLASALAAAIEAGAEDLERLLPESMA